MLQGCGNFDSCTPGEFVDKAAELLFFLEERQSAVGVNGLVIPGRHDFAVLSLGWVPGR